MPKASSFSVLWEVTLAPINPNNTRRVYYTYNNGIHDHTFVVRTAELTGIAGADALVAAVLTEITGFFPATTITGVEESAAGSNIRFPVTSLRQGDTFGSGAANSDVDAQALTFVGKSSGGVLTRLSFFGYFGTISGYRLTSGENAAIAAAVAALNASPVAGIAVDGNTVLWADYANIKPNDYWVKQARA